MAKGTEIESLNTVSSGKDFLINVWEAHDHIIPPITTIREYK